jgi:16S rRNA processing protein RimM
MVAVGRVVRPHGLRGQVVVASETDFGEERFQVGAVMYAPAGEGEPRRLTVTTSREDRGRWVIGFDAVGSIDEAEAMRDAELRIPAEDRRVLEPGAFYVDDLIGCRVWTMTGADVGTVERVEMATGAPVLVVGTDDEILVPLADAICRRVDVAAKIVEIDPPDGLLELNRRRR